MAKFNSTGHRAQPPVAQATSVMRTSGGVTARPDARTFEGALAWNKDAKTDLFLRATSGFSGGEKSFYESADQRDDTLRDLVRKVTLEDPDWVFEFARWLRGPGNIRTASLMIAAEFVKARLDAGLHGVAGTRVGEPGKEWATVSSRAIIDAVCQRADEPGELLAYWTSRYGRKLPKPLKRGIADAVRRLYNERSLLKYDTSSHAYRFGDVLELCHPRPLLPIDVFDRMPEDRVEEMSREDRLAYIREGVNRRGDLFKYAIDRRHNRADEIPESLRMVRANAAFRARAKEAPYLIYDTDALAEAGLTWENALSLSGDFGVDKQKVWESVIPSMGYMALLRNLRNFDETGVSDTVADQVIAKLQDPDQVARSRQLPFRFYSAYLNAPSLRWGRALEKALDLCLPNIPVMPGKSLILVDTSGSMTNAQVSGRSTLNCLAAAALFGAALALKNQQTATLVQYATNSEIIPVPRGGSVLSFTQNILRLSNRCGWGTDIAGAIRRHYTAEYDRVIVLSDGQGTTNNGAGRVGASVPNDKPIYVFNIEGYSQSPMPTGGAARFDLGGLTDATFALIPRLEAGLTGVWPWEIEKTA